MNGGSSIDVAPRFFSIPFSHTRPLVRGERCNVRNALSGVLRSASLHHVVEIERTIEGVPNGRCVRSPFFFGTVPPGSSRFRRRTALKNLARGTTPLQRNAPEESMKLSSPFLHRTLTVAPCLLAFAWFAGACGSDKTTTPPNNTPAASNPDPMADAQQPPPPPPADFDAGTIVCGTNTCAGRFAGGLLGAACCARGGMSCGLNFGQGCIDQSDAGGGGAPMFDAATVVPDPSCGTVSITFGGMSFPLDGCCLPSGICGYYASQMPSIGCLTTDQLRTQGASVPDAPMSCSAEGGTVR
jgi:hypothetical protein